MKCHSYSPKPQSGGKGKPLIIFKNTLGKCSSFQVLKWSVRFLNILFKPLAYLKAALAAAVMNIQLPIYLGNVIEVMTHFIGEGSRGNFSAEMQAPVLSILALYVAQVSTTI